MMWNDEYEARLRYLVVESRPDIFKLVCFIGDGSPDLKTGDVLPKTTVIVCRVFTGVRVHD